MPENPLIFACSLLFLAGVLAMVLAVIPALQRRLPQLLAWGAGATLLSILLVLLIGVAQR